MNHDSFQHGLALVTDHLRALKDDGVRELQVSAGTLRALKSAPSRTPPARGREAASVPARSVGAEGWEHPQKSPQAREDRPRIVEKIPVVAKGLPAAADKAAELERLQARARECRICPHLARTRKQVVFGVGPVEAALMFVGEAPGADEDEQGEPFVGRAGQLLTKMIQAMGLDRGDVYIANILKCRPDMPPGDAGNRPPTAEEIANCKPYLFAQIDLIKPRAMVALGSSAVKGLLGAETPIGKLRGQWQEFRGIPLMPTYHPSYLLRKAGPSGIGEKRKAWEDLMAVMEKLGMSISEKQRGFFKSAM
ncbi:MAG: uracil-DNA glycosylase [Verrucomicrobiae bacterium]|nr:uracil-DNA glycosylase [Verrucomicrobiae bacterium]